MPDRRNIAVSSRTYEAVETLRDLKQARSNRPITLGEVVDDGVRSLIFNPARYKATVTALVGQIVPALSEDRAEGITIDADAQTVEIRFRDREPLVVGCPIPEG